MSMADTSTTNLESGTSKMRRSQMWLFARKPVLLALIPLTLISTGSALVACIRSERVNHTKGSPSVGVSSVSILVKGRLNGIPVAIKRDHLKYPIHYLGTSVWGSDNEYSRRKSDPNDSEISDFTVYLQWPSLAPRGPFNDASYAKSTTSFSPSSWISISVVAEPAQDAAATHQSLALENSRLLQSLMNRMASESHMLSGDKMPIRHPDLKYSVSLDEKAHFGLRFAAPTGRGTDTAWLGNDLLYWTEGPSGAIDTLISCGNGKLPDPTTIHRCRHRFVVPEFQSSVEIGYSSDLLPQWRIIEVASRRYLSSIKAHY
ncbi:hypothetical protein GGR36_004012 [Niveibacterium umoris]|uniref:Uncharacterized protein n=1 Tax=Niveibacterium umoris TaxID=1193620 RepID=A0A840BV20_9RHOO|nr:hypothetical protein [Niveibacterium umoris]